jgi:xanthine/CO dehydrogenase XdhC/CoxF family maturation factor
MELSHMRWRKSTYSGSNGGGCVEVGVWRKASYSGSNGGGCVEVMRGQPATAEVMLSQATVAVRDSKDPDGPRLAFTAGEWRAFTQRVKARGPWTA